MVGIGEISVGFSIVSGVLGLILLTVAARAYKQDRTPGLAFVAGAFTIFSLKSFLVAYAVSSKTIEHELLEFIDAIGDMATILLIALPLIWPQR